MRKPRLGIAFGGGAAKGWAHIGFMQALDEVGIKPDIISGTSIGAVVGSCWASGHLDDLKKFALSLTQRRILSLLDISLSGSSLINGSRLSNLLDEHLEDILIENLPLPFACMATELENGNEIWLTKGSLTRALRASYALPGIFKPVKIGKRWLIDGALVNPVPITACRAMGADFVVGVSLSTSGVGKGTVVGHHMVEDTDNEPAATSLNEVPEIIDELKNTQNPERAIRRKMLGRKNGPPGIYSIMLQSYNIIQDRIARSRMAGDPPDMLASPTVDTIGLFDFYKAEEAIQAGYEAAQPIIGALTSQFAKPDEKLVS